MVTGQEHIHVHTTQENAKRRSPKLKYQAKQEPGGIEEDGPTKERWGIRHKLDTVHERVVH